MYTNQWGFDSQTHSKSKTQTMAVMCLDFEVITHWGRDTMDAIFQTFSNAFSWLIYIISIEIALEFIARSPINNTLVLAQIIVRCRQGDKPLSEPITVSSLLMHICVTRRQESIGIIIIMRHYQIVCGVWATICHRHSQLTRHAGAERINLRASCPTSLFCVASQQVYVYKPQG